MSYAVTLLRSIVRTRHDRAESNCVAHARNSYFMHLLTVFASLGGTHHSPLNFALIRQGSMRTYHVYVMRGSTGSCVLRPDRLMRAPLPQHALGRSARLSQPRGLACDA